MSKAILVLDEMPSSCYECKLHNYHFCDANGESIDYDNRPSHCLLKELPKIREVFNNCDDYLNGIDDGWNSCLYEILGE